MRVIAFLLIIFSLHGCTQTNEIPDDVIPKSKMKTVLWQLMQSDEFVTYVILKDTGKNIEKERIKLYHQVLELNKVSKDEFKKSYQYYLSHPEISKVMFDSLSARASRERDAASKPPEIIKDTIKHTKKDTITQVFRPAKQ
jgi:hypothetical protein